MEARRQAKFLKNWVCNYAINQWRHYWNYKALGSYAYGKNKNSCFFMHKILNIFQNSGCVGKLWWCTIVLRWETSFPVIQSDQSRYLLPFCSTMRNGLNLWKLVLEHDIVWFVNIKKTENYIVVSVIFGGKPAESAIQLTRKSTKSHQTWCQIHCNSPVSIGWRHTTTKWQCVHITLWYGFRKIIPCHG